MNELNDITIKKAANGSKKDFKELYDFYSPFVWKVIFRTVNGDDYDAKQLTQDVFVKMHSVLKSYKFNAAFSTWLYRITYNESMTYLAKKVKLNKRTIEYKDSYNKKEFCDEYENRDMVTAILKTLSPKERFLLVSREINNIPFDELSEIIGKNPGTLRTMLHRIKENLKKGFNYETGKVLSVAV